MKLRTVLVMACATLPFPALADAVGVYIGVGGWDHQPKGTIQYQGNPVDVENDLHLTNRQEAFGWVAIEHPVPLLPNVKLSATKATTGGRGTVAASFTFGGVTFNVNENVDSELSLDQQDAILYWQLLDNVVSLDLGLDIKHVNGDARVKSLSTGMTSSASFNGYVPLLYGNVAISFPLTGLSAGVEGSAVSYDGKSVYDFTGKVSYETKFRVGVEGGYKRQQLKLNDLDGVSSDIRLDGPYAAVFVHF
jgi:outer membrane protein